MRAIERTDIPFFVEYRTMKGWGAVIFDQNYEMTILGEQWTKKESSEHINVLEATALSSTLRTISKISHLDIYVDNTTDASTKIILESSRRLSPARMLRVVSTSFDQLDMSLLTTCVGVVVAGPSPTAITWSPSPLRKYYYSFLSCYFFVLIKKASADCERIVNQVNLVRVNVSIARLWFL